MAYVVVQSSSHVQRVVTPWTAARQASLSLTISWCLPKFLSFESVMPSNHPILQSQEKLISVVFKPPFCPFMDHCLVVVQGLA